MKNITFNNILISFYYSYLNKEIINSLRYTLYIYTFQELVSIIEKTKNVVEATSAPRLYERLDNLQGSLTLCEKALAEYLDTKRLAFPRFYFVSSADLLDILSNGNNPSVVCIHKQYISALEVILIQHLFGQKILVI